MSDQQNRNSFDILRLVAAFMVLWSHQFAFSGEQERIFLGFTPASLGVGIFFAISGYLNAQSVVRGQSSIDFLIKRARRIFPALVGASVFCVFLTATVTTSWAAFWLSVPDFVFRNSTTLFGIRYTLPGVFDGNLYPSAINGSLWTLPNEIKLYIYLAIIAVVTRYRLRPLFFVLLVFLVGFTIWESLPTTEKGHFNNFAILFLFGAMLALAERLACPLKPAILFGFLAAVAALAPVSFSLLPAIAFLSIQIGKARAPTWLQPPIDISYGVYLFAFPIQQYVSTYGISFWPSIAVSAFCTTLLAIASALCIERPAVGQNLKMVRSRPLGM